jgi:hypothetical protein
MAQFAAKPFTNETVHVDGNTYIDCEFKQAKLTYSGGELPVFQGCRFDTCNYNLEGAASRTADFLRLVFSFADSGLKEHIMNYIRGSAPPAGG